MIELLLAGMSAACAWAILNCVQHKDPIVTSRLEGLGVPPADASRAKAAVVQTLLARVGRKFPGSEGASDLDLLKASGTRSFNAESLRGAQICAAAAGFLLGLTAGALAVVVAPVGAWVGYRTPQILLRRRVARRREQAAVALPDAIDLLAVCTHAGLNLPMSLNRVAARSRGVLGQELKRTLEEIELGVPRHVAMRSLAQRNPNGDLEAMVGVLENAERFGTQVSASLESFAEEQARRAPIKILFPLVFFILPAFVLLSVVPLMLSTFSSLGF